MIISKYIYYRKWISIFLLSLGTAVIYLLPYIRYSYYDPMLQFLNLSEEQYSIAGSSYGATAIISYIFGGWIADKFDTRKMLTLSFLSTGIVGFYLYSVPSYYGVIIAHILLGITTVLTFWAVTIKAVGMLGTEEEQGKTYGFYYGLRGLSGVAIVGLGLLFFKSAGEKNIGIGYSYVLLFYSTITFLTGILIWFLFKPINDKQKKESKRFGLKDFLSSLLSPDTWLIGIIIGSIYLVQSGMGYLNPYMHVIFVTTPFLTAFLGSSRSYLFPFLCGPLAGWINDKYVKSPLKIILFSFIGVLGVLIANVLIPGNPKYMILAVVLMMLLSFAIDFAVGIQWSVISDFKVNSKKRGTVISLSSIVGYSPDFFLPLVFNFLIASKEHSKENYNHFFIFMLLITILGFSATIYGVLKKKKSKQI